MADLNINLASMLKKKDVLVAAGVVILALLVAKNIYGKQMRRYEAMKQQIDAEKEKGAALERIIALNEKIKKVKNRSWTSTDMDFIIDKIHNIGLKAQIKIRDISFGEKNETKNSSVVPISFACEAPYKGLVQLMKKIEAHPMIIRVKTLSLGPTADSSSRRDPILRASFAVEVVYLK